LFGKVTRPVVAPAAVSRRRRDICPKDMAYPPQLS
jgi:hypothetical protein